MVNESDENKTSINKLDFTGLGEEKRVDLNLNYEGPENFKFDGNGNKIEWSIVNDDKELDNSGIIEFTRRK